MAFTATDEAFEDATEIYRYLRFRRKILPIYMNRNLTYVLNRSKRKSKARSTFKVDSFIDNIKNALPVPLNDYMTLMFSGYIDDFGFDVDAVEVETFLLRTSLEQNEGSPIHQFDCVGKSTLKINPDNDATSQSKIPVVSVLSANFKPSESSYKLIFTARVASNIMDTISENNNKVVRGIEIFESALDIFDAQDRCQLTDAEYEVPLHNTCSMFKSKKFSLKSQTTWESEEIVLLDKLMIYDSRKVPVLKFRLLWTKERYPVFIDRPLPTDQCENGNTTLSVDNIEKESATIIELEYNLHIKKNTRHVMKPRDIYECPWCQLNCLVLYTLLKHLRLCHARFNFTYVPFCGARLIISVHANELYDDSDEFDDPLNRFFSRNRPIRKIVYTRILVHRMLREKPSLAEFFDVTEFHSQRLYVSGSNHIFYHATSLQPVQANDLDSEDEMVWLPKQYERSIDKLAYVNEGEKEIMKMWNNHMLKNRYVEYNRPESACETFVDRMGIEILRKNLYQNFVLHVCQLADIGVITSEAHLQIILRLQHLLASDKESQEVMKGSREEHKIYWKTSQATPNQQQIIQKDKSDKKENSVGKPNRTTTGGRDSFPTLIAGSSSIRHNTLEPTDLADELVKSELNRHSLNFRKSDRPPKPKKFW